MSTDRKVVSINGGEPVIAPGEVRPEVVKIAEEILEAARAGEIQGLAVAYYHRDETCSHQYGGKVSFALIGKVEVMKHKMAHEYDD